MSLAARYLTSEHGKVQMKKETENWIRSGSVLSADPSAKISCPVCRGANLEVRDVRYGKNPELLERHLACPKCGAKNILHMKRPLSE